MKSTLKLHVGGETPKVGWKILNVIAGPNVDFVGNCTDLSQFADNSVAETYISRVLEHDFHCSDCIFQFFDGHLKHAKFTQIRRVKEFRLFQDPSNVVYNGVPISLNVEATKSADAPPTATPSAT